MDAVDATGRRTVSAPPPIKEVADVVRYQAQSQPNAVALVFEGRETTYAELDRVTSRVANGLRELNPAAGTRIATLNKNSDYHYELLLGAAKAGQVLVPVNYRLAPPEIVAIINDAGATALFVGPEYFATVEQILPQLHSVRTVITLSGDYPGWEDYRSWRERQSARDPMLPTDPDDVVFQIYTSGTTGRPKGAQHTQASVLAALEGGARWMQGTSRDVSLVCIPQYHIGGTNNGCRCLMVGARTVIVREINPGELLRVISTERVTTLFVVPAVLLLLLRHPDCPRTDFSSLRLIVYGASPIPLDLLRQALATFHCDFGQAYGMTEASTIAYLPPEDHDPRGTARMRSCGRPIAGAEIKVVDDQGQEVPTGQVGEIVCRCRQNMKGYWNLPNETAKTIRDGWLHTGDAGYFDADGYLYIHDRIKDMIVSGGSNVYPAEVENALFGHPAVRDVAVIAVPDERWGEAVKAIVVREPGSDVTAEELIAFGRTRIAGYKLPKSIDFVEALPRNPSGKILKRELRAPYWQGHERQVN